MKINVEEAQFDEKEFQAVVISLFEGEKLPKGYVTQLNQALGGTISEITSSADFEAERNQTQIIYSLGKIKTRRVILVAMGKPSDFSLESVRATAGKVGQRIRDLELSNYATLLPGENFNFSIQEVVQSVVEGTELALYRFDRYKSDKNKKNQLDKVTILVQNHDSIPKAEEGIRIGKAVVEGVKLARDLANTPGKDCTPTILAKEASKIARKYGFKCRILEPKDMAKLGMGGIIGVSQGSQQPAKLIIMEYMGGRTGDPPIMLLGKGITFDSGGISIKPSEKMDEMKFDKSGGATVIGTMRTLADLKLPLNIVGMVPATENLLGGGAYKPGDVLTFFKGKTAEILNTDAEGRVVLGDTLSYATDYNPQIIIDLAALTGACVIALGSEASGLFGNNAELKKRIIAAGEATGEKVWELPLWNEYRNQIKSDVADIKNTGGRSGGAITAAAFLAEFVEDYPWAHLDIAGTAYSQTTTPAKPYQTKGATGVGVRLLTHLLQKWKTIPTNANRKSKASK